jgi:hypothetical protein
LHGVVFVCFGFGDLNGCHALTSTMQHFIIIIDIIPHHSKTQSKQINQSYPNPLQRKISVSSTSGTPVPVGLGTALATPLRRSTNPTIHSSSSSKTNTDKILQIIATDSGWCDVLQQKVVQELYQLCEPATPKVAAWNGNTETGGGGGGGGGSGKNLNRNVKMEGTEGNQGNDEQSGEMDMEVEEGQNRKIMMIDVEQQMESDEKSVVDQQGEIEASTRKRQQQQPHDQHSLSNPNTADSAIASSNAQSTSISTSGGIAEVEKFGSGGKKEPLYPEILSTNATVSYGFFDQFLSTESSSQMHAKKKKLVQSMPVVALNKISGLRLSCSVCKRLLGRSVVHGWGKVWGSYNSSNSNPVGNGGRGGGGGGRSGHEGKLAGKEIGAGQGAGGLVIWGEVCCLGCKTAIDKTPLTTTTTTTTKAAASASLNLESGAEKMGVGIGNEGESSASSSFYLDCLIDQYNKQPSSRTPSSSHQKPPLVPQPTIPTSFDSTFIHTTTNRNLRTPQLLQAFQTLLPQPNNYAAQQQQQQETFTTTTTTTSSTQENPLALHLVSFNGSENSDEIWGGEMECTLCKKPQGFGGIRVLESLDNRAPSSSSTSAPSTLSSTGLSDADSRGGLEGMLKRMKLELGWFGRWKDAMGFEMICECCVTKYGKYDRSHWNRRW